MVPLRIATRRSRLALAQSRLVADALSAALPGQAVELVPMDTRGDRQRGPLAPIGGKGLFTLDLEQALRTGQVDLAVHSAKDLPARLPGDMTIAVTPARVDPRDALISRGGVQLEALPAGFRLGTSSLRRAAAILAHRPDARIEPLRGNVETRLGRVLSGEVDATVLAMAGLIRSGLLAEHAAHVTPLPIDHCPPAAGQGVLAVQALTLAGRLIERIAAIDDADTHAALLAERSVVRALAATCSAPLGVHVYRADDGWHALALLADPADLHRRCQPAVGAAETPQAAAQDVVAQLQAAGAADWLRPSWP